MLPTHDTSLFMAARRVSPRIHAVPAPKSTLVRFADAVDCPVALVNREGRVTSVNAQGRDYFIGKTGVALRQSVEAAVRVAIGERRKGPEASRNPAKAFEIGHERFHVTIVLAGSDVVGQDIGAMVMLRREHIASAPLVSEHALERRFGLTKQEARVAVMLAEQRSNRDIADKLGVSVHTARHHTERVLAKLEIHSRYDVRRAIG